MGIVIDKLLGDALMHSHPIETVSADPASAAEGSLILNTSDDKIKIYYAGSWQTLHTLTPAADYFLKLESGDFFLLENGDKLILG